MKYICKECGSEFSEKPDFCDCGNDTFDEIVEEVKVEEKIAPQKEEPVKIEQPQVEKKVYNSTYKPMEMGEKIYWAIFLVCILLSILVILFFANPKPEDLTSQEAKPTQTEQNQANMPAIDSFWDNSIQPQEQQKKNLVKNVEAKPESVLKVATQSKKQGENVLQKANPLTQKVNKPIQNSKTATPQTKPSTTSKPQTTAVQPLPVQAQQPTPAEIRNYKEALRKRIVANIDFMNIIGDGYCEVTFSVTPTGKITYPTGNVFTVKSENPSLNDSVFAAMRTVTSFNAPPQGKALNYMHLRVSLYGNEFSVYLN